MSPDKRPEHPSNLQGIIEKTTQAEADAWVNSLPAVPAEEKPRIRELIFGALAAIREEHRPQK